MLYYILRIVHLIATHIVPPSDTSWILGLSPIWCTNGMTSTCQCHSGQQWHSANCLAEEENLEDDIGGWPCQLLVPKFPRGCFLLSAMKPSEDILVRIPVTSMRLLSLLGLCRFLAWKISSHSNWHFSKWLFHYFKQPVEYLVCKWYNLYCISDIELNTPPKFNIDTPKLSIFEKEIFIFQTYHFLYLFVQFPWCTYSHLIL